MTKKTIKELADEIGVSKTAINNNVTPAIRKEYFSKVGNRFEISEKGQSVIRSMFVDDFLETENRKLESESSTTESQSKHVESQNTQSKPKSSTTESQNTQTSLHSEHDLSKNAMLILKNYQNQLQKKDQQLSDLHKLLDQQQQLTLQSNRQNERLQLQLEVYEEETSSVSSEEVSTNVKQEQPKKWWQFWV